MQAVRELGLVQQVKSSRLEQRLQISPPVGSGSIYSGSTGDFRSADLLAACAGRAARLRAVAAPRRTSLLVVDGTASEGEVFDQYVG